MLSAADDDDSLAVRAELEMNRHAAGLIVARTDGHMHSSEDFFAVMFSNIVLTKLRSPSIRDMGAEATQIYILLKKGVACDTLMSALAHALSCKTESL